MNRQQPSKNPTQEPRAAVLRSRGSQPVRGSSFAVEGCVKSYSEKLKDFRWQSLRRQILERDGRRCLACGKSDRTLEVHHKWYFGEPWEAPPEALESLCEACHEWRTETQLSLRKMSTGDLRDYLSGGGRAKRRTISKMIESMADEMGV